MINKKKTHVDNKKMYIKKHNGRYISPKICKTPRHELMSWFVDHEPELNILGLPTVRFFSLF